MKKRPLPSVVCLVLDPLLGLKVQHIYSKISQTFEQLWTLSCRAPTSEAPIHAQHLLRFASPTASTPAVPCRDIPGTVLQDGALHPNFSLDGRVFANHCWVQGQVLISARWAQGKQPSLGWRALVLALFTADQKLPLSASVLLSCWFQVLVSPSPLSILLQESFLSWNQSSSLFMADGGQECT